MSATNLNNVLINGYLGLLEGLSNKAKLDLIERLQESLASNKDATSASFYSSFGAWDSSETAEELIDKVRSARTAATDREPL